MTQIHYMENGSVEIYSRNAERNTEKFPDVVVAVSRYSFYFSDGCFSGLAQVIKICANACTILVFHFIAMSTIFVKFLS